jgi:hypothetical protein
MGELVSRGHVERPDPGAPGQFAWARPGTIEERLEGAGFNDYLVDTVDFVHQHSSFDEWMATQTDLSSTFRTTLEDLPAGERDDVLGAIREQALPYAQEDGSLVLPARTWVAAATA